MDTFSPRVRRPVAPPLSAEPSPDRTTRLAFIALMLLLGLGLVYFIALLFVL